MAIIITAGGGGGTNNFPGKGGNILRMHTTIIVCDNIHFDHIVQWERGKKNICHQEGEKK